MKKRDDIEEIDDEIIDDEILDDDEIIDDEEEIIEDVPKRKTTKPKDNIVININMAQNVGIKNDVKVRNKVDNKVSNKVTVKNKTKVAIISSSVVVGVVAIALVVLFVILPLAGIDLFGKKKAGLYYNPEASYGLYFYGDDHEPYNDDMEAVDMVRASTSLSKSYFDPSKPTIIWFHGWEPTGSVGDRYLMAGGDTRKVMEDYDCSYAHELKELGYNVATIQFQGVNKGDKNYAVNLGKIYQYAVKSFDDDSKYSLSYMFASEIATVLGNTYSKDITFVGHSCGGFMSTATNYMLQYFYKTGLISNPNLVAKRLILQDPYVNKYAGEAMGADDVIMGTDEKFNGRVKNVVIQDMITSLHTNSNVAIEVYLGMTMASSEFVKEDSHFETAMQHCVTIDLTGLKNWVGIVGNVHVLSRDWVWRSMLEEKLEDQNGDLAPSAACTNAEILGMVGNLYQQQNTEWDFSTEVLKKVPDTSEFKV